MKTIPQVRKELLVIAESQPEAVQRKIRALVRDMYRRPAVRRVKIESVEYTPELGRRIKTFANSRRNMSYKRIANRFHVSIGRVSEALVGKRAA